MRTFEPPPRSTVVLPDAPEFGPVVTPKDWSAGDRAVAQYFWTSTDKDEDAWTCSDASISRVINFGMKAVPVPHGTPFGHGHLTVLIERIDLPTAEQLLRHRVAVQSPDGDSTGYLMIEWAPNISKKSLRYTSATNDAQSSVEERFYVPRPEDVRQQVGRPGHYTFIELAPELAEDGIRKLRAHYAAGQQLYDELRADGWSNEQARYALSTGLLTRMYVTNSYRNWFNLLVQRNDSHSQGEMQMVARQVEEIMAQLAPITYDLWLSHGRRVI